jgi:hypothetical protein
VLLCKIIIILNMEIVASKEEIVGNPKLLGAGPEQQAAGPVSNPQQQQQQKSLGASAVSGQGLPQQAALHTNAGYRLEGGGIGQSNNGSYSNGHGGGSAVPQATGTSNPYSVAISGVKTDSGDFQRPAMGGVGGVNS